MKRVFPLLFIFFLKTITACECPQLQPITKDLCNKYEVIFWGEVDSISAGTKKGYNTAHFSIKELYKGSVRSQTTVDFDVSSACLMSFAKGEEWLIYANYKKFDYLTVDICSHSRKYFSDASNDFYQLASKQTFEEEKKFLETTLTIQPLAKVNELYEQEEQFRPHNIQPEPISKIWLLIISVISMAIVFFVTRKKNK